MQRQPSDSGSACFSWNWLWLCKQGYLFTLLTLLLWICISFRFEL